MTLAEFRAALDAANAALRSLHEEIGSADPTDAQVTRWDELDEARNAAQTALGAAREAADAEARDADDAAQEEARAAQERSERLARVRESRNRFGGVNVGPSRSGDSELRFGNPMQHQPTAVRSALLRAMEQRLSDLPTETGQKFDSIVRSFVHGNAGGAHEYAARSWQQKLLIRSHDDYARAWSKYVSGNAIALTPEEARAIAVGTNTSGGYLVPTHLDPTIIIVNDGAEDVIRRLSTARGGVKLMLPGTGNFWEGITSAGMTTSWDAEASAVSDDTPGFDRDGISIKNARGWAEATFQALVNIAGIESELYSMFADAKNRAEATVHATGAGSATEPTGLITALVAATTRQIVSTTAAEIGVVDINKVYRNEKLRWRGRGSWLMNPLYADAVQALGTAVGVAYTGSIANGYGGTLKGRPWEVSDDMPTSQTTNVKDPEIAFGDFGQYYLVDRPGTMAVEFVPNVMDPSTGRPLSKRGWLCWWEHGADLFVPEGFTLLVDKTTT